jgi:hypothetical protein
MGNRCGVEIRAVAALRGAGTKRAKYARSREYPELVMSDAE